MKKPPKTDVRKSDNSLVAVKKPFQKPVRTTRAAIRRAVKKVVADREGAHA